MHELVRTADADVNADTDRFAVVGRLGSRRLQITAATPQAAAAAADFWRTRYSGVTATWFLRDDLPQDRLILLLVRWRLEFLGNGERAVHAIPLVPGIPADAHPISYCHRTLPLTFMEICDFGRGTPCAECLRLAALAYSP